MKKLMLVVCLLSAMMGSVAQAETLLLDTFETHTLGSSIIGLTPDVGSNWNSLGSVLSEVENTTVFNGGQALSFGRDASNFGTLRAISTGFMQENTTVTWSLDWYRAAIGDGFGFFASAGEAIAGGPAGLLVQNGVYSYRQRTGASSGLWAPVASGTVAPVGSWSKIDVEMTIGAVSGGVYDATYDLFVTPDGGSKTLMQGNIAAGFIAENAGPLRFNLLMLGNGDTVFLDDVSITRVPEPASMVLLGIGSIGLLRRNKRLRS